MIQPKQSQVKKMKNKITFIAKYWLPPLLWAVVIFLFSSHPTKGVSEIHWQDFIVKKTAHLIEYGFLAILIYRGLINSKVKNLHAGIAAILVSFIYGATDEIHQMFTPGRESTIRDVIFDTIGAVIVIYFIWRLLPKAPKRLKTLAKKLEIS